MPEYKCQTYGEQFKSALACETTEQAEEWMEAEVRHFVDFHGETPQGAVKIIKHNIGYMAGYYDNTTVQKIHRLFNAVHPIFGTAMSHADVGPERALELGKKLAEKET